MCAQYLARLGPWQALQSSVREADFWGKAGAVAVGTQLGTAALGPEAPLLRFCDGTAPTVTATRIGQSRACGQSEHRVEAPDLD